MVLTCEDNRDIYSSVKIQIVMTSGTDTNSGQNNRITGSLSSDVTNITITISGVEPVNVNVTSGETVTQTIDGVPLGEQTVKIDLKDADGIILYTQTQTVTVEAGKTVSPTFPADDFTAENVEIELTSPNGGEAWQIGTTHEITWTTSHPSENVAITLYKNSASYQLLSTATASTGSYSWTIADTIDEGSNYTIRVALVSDPETFDESNNSFTLASTSQPTLTVTSPNGGENWELGSTHDITWTSSDLSGDIKIELYQGGSMYQTILDSTDDDGSYSWTIPDSYDEGSNYNLRISSVSDGNVYDDSDNTFTLTSTSQPTLTVTSPNGGENWELGSTHDITWTSSSLVASSIPTNKKNARTRTNFLQIMETLNEKEKDLKSQHINLESALNRTQSETRRGNVKIELYKGASLYQTIAESIDDNGSYSWTIPASYDGGSDYKVRISSLSDGSVYDQSDDYFTLFTAENNPTITVITPNGGEDWEWFNTYEIIWESENLEGNVKIELIDIDGGDLQTITESTGNNGSFSWDGDACGGQMKVKITSIENPNTNDLTDGWFTFNETTLFNISHDFDITSPSPGDVYTAGDDIEVLWNNDGGSDVTVALYNIQTENQNWIVSGSGNADDGAYTLTIPEDQDPGIYKVYLGQVFSPNGKDYSDCYFTILAGDPIVNVVSPNGGEEWELGSTHDITWNTSFISGNIKIELFKDGSAYQIIEGSTENNGSYSWTIPSTYDADNDYRVRISSVEVANVYDESDNDFSISYPPYIITSPNGNEEWELGSTHDITWTSGNVSDNVKIELYQDGSAYQIIEGSTDDDGTHSWTIPSSYDEGNDYKVRISSVSDATVYDESDANFTLTAADQQTTWTNTFGGVFDEEGNSVQQTSDGGYILTGYTKSYGNTYGDVWLIKTDSQGSEEWNQTFGGGSSSKGYSVRQTSDGGYIIAGYINPTYGNTYTDIWLIKTDSQGNEEWNQTYGGNSYDYGYSVEETSDGGYIIIGDSEMSGSPIFLIKTDSQGNEEWEQTFNETNYSQFGRSVKQTSDGGYIITGYSRAGGVASDVLLIKADSEGNEEWKQTFGGNSADYGYSVEETSDGGYIITGETESYGSSKDVWLIKTDSQGNEVWNQTFGGSDDDSGHSVEQTLDGGYIITGYTDSFGNGYYHDVWLIKTDSGGQEEWNQTYGGSFSDEGRSVQQTLDGGYIITGYTRPAGATYDDVWLIKTDSQGNISE
ncbi:Ser-Thr-rich GPI-anchored membrane family protein [Candidatus Marinimicrobia bacterium]|nr:Ser-Thr-rich GPI-anchored membrane family protein [Candidatus Neomarinimicrobiota bacterium]